MAKGNIDLDRSLDDIIKHSKARQPRAGKPAAGRGPVDSRRGGRRDVNNRVSAPVNRTTNTRGGGKNIAINRRIGREGVTDKIPPKNINSRLSKGGISKPQRGSSSFKRGGAVGVRKRDDYTLSLFLSLLIDNVQLIIPYIREIIPFHQEVIEDNL